MDTESVEATAFYISIEAILSITVPKYLKKNLIINGYHNDLMLSSITNDDLTEIENFAKDTLPKIIPEEEFNNYFGIFHRNIQNFTIAPGHRKLIFLISKYCKDKLDKESAIPSPSFTSSAVLLEEIPHSLASPTSSACSGTHKNSSKASNSVSIDFTEENRSVSRIVRNWIRSKYISKYSPEQWTSFGDKCNDINFTTKLDATSSLTCKIECYCQRVFTVFKQPRNDNTKPRWLCGNFYRHFTAEHINESGQAQISTNRLGIKRYFPLVGTNSTCTKMQKNEYVTTTELPKVNIISDICINQGTFENLEAQTLVEDEVEGNRTSPDMTQSHFSSITNNEHSLQKSWLSKWSSLKYQRKERRRRLREKKGSELQLITNYFPLVHQVQTVINENPGLEKRLCENLSIMNDHFNADNKDPEKKVPNEFLNRLYDIAVQNSKNCSNRNRYNNELKKFALYLFYIGGRLLYETLQSNLKQVLPSISSLNRFASNNQERMREGFFNFDGLKAFLEQRNLPMFVWLSEDGTRITGKVEYDETSNKLVGFVLPLQNGMPETETYFATSAKEIESYFTQHPKANYAYTIMVQPLCQNAPPYCLAIFGTDNRFNSQDVKDRWNYVMRCLHNLGITVVGISSDGDSRLLKAMRENSGIFVEEEPREEHVHILNDWDWFRMPYQSDTPSYIQDTFHVATKLRTRILKQNIILPMGRYGASVSHLHSLLQKTSKDQHQLTMSDLKGEDKMNFLAARRMCSTRVLHLLQTHLPESIATTAFLRVMNYSILALTEKNITVLDRVYYSWYCVFFLRFWKEWLKENKYKITDHFVSTNTYTCIELNAHSLIKLIIHFQENNLSGDMFLPWLFNSQTCEQHFRATRSLTSTFSTVVNFSMKDILRRTDRIQMIHNIMTDLNGIFIFPRQEKKCHSVTPLNSDVRNISIADIERSVNTALVDCIANVKELGMYSEKDTYICRTIETQFYENQDNDLIRDDASIDEEICLVESETESTSEQSNEPKYSILSEKLSTDFIKEERKELNEQSDHLLVDMCELQSLGNTWNDVIDLKNYSIEENRILNENSNYVRVSLGNKKSTVIKKSSLCWLLDQGRERVSTDRLRRFVQNHKRNNKSTEKSTIISRKTKICVGEWCVFISRFISIDDTSKHNEKDMSIPNDISIARILSFDFLGDGHKQARILDHIMLNTKKKNERTKCICTLYRADERGCVSAEDENATIVYLVSQYMYTIPQPEVIIENNKIQLRLSTEILKQIRDSMHQINKHTENSNNFGNNRGNNRGKNQEKRLGRNKMTISDLSSNDDGSIEFDDSTDTETFSDSSGIEKMCETDGINTLEAEDIDKTDATLQCDKKDILVDDFIVVQLLSEKGNKRRFIAKVLAVNPYRCSFLRPARKTKNAYVYPEISDQADIENEEIIAKLPKPLQLRRGGLLFEERMLKKYILNY